VGVSSRPATEGRIVHVRTPGVDHCQPAIVVRAWGDGTGSLNLVVIRDGSNDAAYSGEEPRSLTSWATSVTYQEAPATGEPWPAVTARSWHWPEQV